MACNNEIHKDDLGTEFIVTITRCVNDVDVALNISSASSMIIKFKKSDAAVDSHTAVFTSISSGGAGDGTDGKISYFSVAGDLDLTGTYKIQGVVTTPSGSWSSVVKTFKVITNI